MPSSNYETFEHEADIGVRGYGASMEEAFANAAKALYSVMVDLENVRPGEKRYITASGQDYEILLVEWLNALLSASDIERMVFSEFEVRIRRDAEAGLLLSGAVWGERLDPERHSPRVEVKAATLHMLRVERHAEGYIAQCVVDV